MTAQVLNWEDAPRDVGAASELLELIMLLPQLHTELSSGKRCPVRTAHELMRAASRVAIEGVVPTSDEVAAFTWIAHTFAVAAAERWNQAAGFEPGEAFSLLGHDARAWIEAMMQRTGAAAPRQREHEYWLNNSIEKSSPTFTGSDGEHAFRREVQLVDRESRAIADTLWRIVRRDMALRDSADALKLCTAAATRMGDGMRDLGKRFQPGEFALGMRQALLPFPCPFAESLPVDGALGYTAPFVVNGKTHSGPNAANIPGPALVDKHLGLMDARYGDMISSRREFYRPEDRIMIDKAMEDGPSIVDLMALNLGVGATELLSCSTERFAGLLHGADRQVVEAITELARFGAAYRQWSGAHLGGIRTHVEDASHHIPGDLIDTLPVGCREGVSGNSLDDVKHIAMLRRSGFATSKLHRGLQLSLTGTGGGALKEVG